MAEQFFYLCVLVVIVGLITYFMTAESFDRRYKEMVRQYRDAMETLGQANQRLRDEKQELIDELSHAQHMERTR